MNPMQKYPQITELFDHILYKFVFMFLFSMNFLVSIGTCSTPKLSKQIISICNTYKAIQCAPASACSSRFIPYAPTFIFLGKLFLE